MLKMHHGHANQNLKTAQRKLKYLTTKLIATERENRRLGINGFHYTYNY